MRSRRRNLPRDEAKLSGAHPFDGAVVVNLSPAVAEELSLEDAWSGVAIERIARGGIAGRIGFQRGDIILSVNGQRLVSRSVILNPH